jgi:signal recognition particle subunit SRP54
MFDSLSDRLGNILDKIKGRGALSESDVNEALREVRRALIEADVALEVVKTFVEKVRVRAIGAEVLRSIKPGQMVVKIVHDILIETLGSDTSEISLEAVPPVVIMMVGLQGSGKTTTSAKIAKRYADKHKKKVMLASLDTRRPAAQAQLEILAKQVNVGSLPIVAGQTPTQIAKRGMDAARLAGYDILILDTAGRTHIDDELMREVADIEKIAKPHETLLVVDSLMGQDAVNVARSFTDRLNVTGIVLTRVDGDGRGGAALSMRAVTGKPIKVLGTGEKMDAIEDFDPRRIAGRILGMGDIVSLVEKAVENIDQAQAAAMADKMRKGQFDLNDLKDQLTQMIKMGGLGSLMNMMPGMAAMKGKPGMPSDKVIVHQKALIESMTPWERRNPREIDGKRKRRIAAGAGLKPEDVNKLLKSHRGMADMMKQMGGKNPGRGKMAGLASMFGMGGGGMPEMPTLPPSGLPDKMPSLSPAKPGLPGLGAKSFLPSGFPFGKK